MRRSGVWEGAGVNDGSTAAAAAEEALACPASDGSKLRAITNKATAITTHSTITTTCDQGFGFAGSGVIRSETCEITSRYHHHCSGEWPSLVRSSLRA